MSGSGSTMIAVLRDRSLGVSLSEKARGQFGEHAWIAVTETA
jgi:hypothetical protein